MVQVRIDDPRMAGTWQLVAATSGHLDERPRIEAGRLAIESRGDGRLVFVAQLRTPRGVRHIRGPVPTRPRLRRPRTWLTIPLWLASIPFHGDLYLGAQGTVAAAVTPGSMLLNPGTVLLARADLEPTAAHRAITHEMAALGLTATQLREMSWRISAPGTDSSRFGDGPMRAASELP